MALHRRWSRFAVLPVIATLLHAACNTGSATGPSQNPQVSGVSVTGPANSVAIAGTLQLTASVAPTNAPQTVTWSTSDPSIATVSNAGLVTGITSGPVTITAASTANAAVSGSIQLNVTCPAPRTVASNPTGNTTWQNWIADPACLDYIVSVDVNMQAGVLTIEPGTIVGFEAGRTMRIAASAGIVAAGTASDRITLTGTQQARGHWGGLFFDNSSFNGNRLEHITIEYAGVNNWSGSVIRANVMLVNTATTLFEAVLRESAAYGLSMNAGSSLPLSADNVFTRNASGPVHAWASVVSNVVLGIPTNNVPGFSGNDRDVFDVLPNTVAGANHRWHDIGIPYRILAVSNSLAFQVTGHLTVTAGATIEFEQDMALLVRDGGRLETPGTAAHPIAFTGSVQTPGHWRGLGFQDTDSQLDFTIVEYGGRAIIGLGDQEPANVQITTGDATTATNVTITNSTLRHSSAYGLYARSIGVSLPGFENNTLTQNALGAAYVDAPIVDHLSSSGTYTGNGNDRVHVNTAARTLAADATWRDLGVAFDLDGRGIGTPIFTVDGVSLTIEPGVEVLFDTNMGLDVRSGSLTAVGTPTSQITFRPSGSPWRGIRIFESSGSLDHLTFNGGGSTTWSGNQQANLVIASAGQNAANVMIGPGVTSSPSSEFGLAFSFGPTVAVQCGFMGKTYIPPPDPATKHCPAG